MFHSNQIEVCATASALATFFLVFLVFFFFFATGIAIAAFVTPLTFMSSAILAFISLLPRALAARPKRFSRRERTCRGVIAVAELRIK